MKRIITTMFILTAWFATVSNSFAQGNAAAIGSWDMTLETPQGTRNFPFHLKEENGKLLPSPPFKSAEVKGDAITMHMTVKFQENDLEITYTDKIAGDAMSGDADFGGLAQGTWTAKRKAAGSTPASGSAAAAAVNVTGTWSATVETSQGSGTPTFTFKQEGETLSGNYKGQLGEAPLNGSVKGNDITFNIKLSVQGQDFDITYSGKVEGTTMKGKAMLGPLGEANWTAKKN
ncbi:MAG: hypothetical protein HY231_01735 [Acidobacteria bacterium]|nr:hypothetical protein [Acidobacteriota bacterium]